MRRADRLHSHREAMSTRRAGAMAKKGTMVDEGTPGQGWVGVSRSAQVEGLGGSGMSVGLLSRANMHS